MADHHSIYTYKTLADAAEGIYTDKGSKFIGYVFPAMQEEDCKAEIKRLKSLHTGARHFCYAWRMGKDVFTERSNDDGEPSGTAGRPILNQLISAGLTNTCIVVVRYFGGTLLGTSGLIQAYKGAAREALNHGKILEKEITITEEMSIGYEHYAELMKLVKQYEVVADMISSDEKEIRFSMQVPKRRAEEFKTGIFPLLPGQNL